MPTTPCATPVAPPCVSCKLTQVCAGQNSANPRTVFLPNRRNRPSGVVKESPASGGGTGGHSIVTGRDGSVLQLKIVASDPDGRHGTGGRHARNSFLAE